MTTESENTNTNTMTNDEWWDELDAIKESLLTVGAMLDDVSKQNKEAIAFLNNTPMIRVSNAAKVLLGGKR